MCVCGWAGGWVGGWVGVRDPYFAAARCTDIYIHRDPCHVIALNKLSNLHIDLCAPGLDPSCGVGHRVCRFMVLWSSGEVHAGLMKRNGQALAAQVAWDSDVLPQDHRGGKVMWTCFLILERFTLNAVARTDAAKKARPIMYVQSQSFQSTK
jgi:hypothetical protein